MKKVVCESPFGRNPDGSKCTPAQYERNRRYLNRCLADCLRRDESPYASHRFFPGILDDTIPEERKRGIEAGQEWGVLAELCAVYVDHGETEGMSKSIRRYVDAGMAIELRHIGVEPDVELAPSVAELLARIAKLEAQRNELAEYADPNLLRSMDLTDHKGERIEASW